MFDQLGTMLDLINGRIFIGVILIFFAGYTFAPTACYKNISWMTAYPRWIIRVMDRFFTKHHHPFVIFALLFVLNTASLTVNLFSGWGVILPPLVIWFLGINVGVVMYLNLQGRYYYLSLFNPVALLELPAAWLSLTMAIQFSLSRFFEARFIPEVSFSTYLAVFLYLIVPVLFFAAVLETIMIVKGLKQEPPNLPEADE